MIAMAEETILLCDSAKFGKVSFAKFATLSEIDCLASYKVEERHRFYSADCLASMVMEAGLRQLANEC